MVQPDDLTEPSYLRRVWEKAYTLDRANHLWGAPSLPFVAEASARFAAGGATVLLDLGCGDGRNTVALARNCAAVIGMDISPMALRLCQRRISAAKLHNVVLVEGDAARTPFQAQQFGGVFCANLLGQLKDFRPVLSEILRVTRDGGIIVFNVLADDDPMALDMGPDLAEHVYSGRYFYRYFDRGSVEALLADAGAVEVLSIKRSRWIDAPHEGYREEEHEHRSWVVTLRKSPA